MQASTVPLEKNADNSLRRIDLAWLVLITILGAYLRLFDLNDWQPSIDETFAVEMSTIPSSLTQLIDKAFAERTHPPFVYLLLRAISYFGHAQLTYALIALIPGICLIPLWYLLGWKLGGRIPAVAMSVLAALSPSLIIYSQIWRGYMLYVLSVSALLLFFELYRQHPQRILISYYLFFALIAVLTHYSACIPVGVIGSAWIYHVLRQPGRTLNILLVGNFLLGLIFVFQAAGSYSYGHLGEYLNEGKYSFYVGMMLSNSEDLAKRVAEVSAWLFVNPGSSIVPLINILFVAGLALLLRDRKWTAIWCVAAPYALCIATAFAKLYFFNPSRHCLFLAPFTALGIVYPLHRMNKTYGNLAGRLCLTFFLAALFLNAASPEKGVIDTARVRAESRFYLNYRKSDLLSGMKIIQDSMGENDVVVHCLRLWHMLRFQREHWGFKEKFPRNKVYVCKGWSALNDMIDPRRRPTELKQCLEQMLKRVPTETRGAQGWLFGLNEFRGERALLDVVKNEPFLKITGVTFFETLEIVSFDIDFARSVLRPGPPGLHD